MPAPTVEQLAQRAASFKKTLAAQGEALEPVKLRGLRKKLRRTQRKRRAAVVAAARNAPKAKPAAEAAATPPAEAPAEEAKGE